MRRRPLWPASAAAAFFLACALVGAASPGAQAQGRAPVATLLVAGPYVFVNGSPAQNGMPIGWGDHVTTGAASSAMLYFTAGGSIQLDANTDPDVWGPTIGTLRCWLRIFGGQLFAEGEGVSICSGDGAQLLAHSALNLAVGPGGELLTVAEGTVWVATGSRWTMVPGGSQASIAGRRVLAQRPLSPAELARATAWRSQYNFVSAQPYLPPPRYIPTPLPFPWPDYGRDREPRPRPTPGGDREPGHHPPPDGGYKPPGGGSKTPGGGHKAPDGGYTPPDGGYTPPR